MLALLLFFVSAGADPFVGTWHLNPAKSKWANGAPPKEKVIRMEETPAGIRYSSETTNPDGSKSTGWYTAKYDGKEVHIVGNVYWDPVALTSPKPGTVVATFFKRGKPSAVATRVVSKDGSTMTITTEASDKVGKKFTNVGVYERH